MEESVVPQANQFTQNRLVLILVVGGLIIAGVFLYFRSHRASSIYRKRPELDGQHGYYFRHNYKYCTETPNKKLAPQQSKIDALQTGWDLVVGRTQTGGYLYRVSNIKTWNNTPDEDKAEMIRAIDAATKPAETDVSRVVLIYCKPNSKTTSSGKTVPEDILIGYAETRSGQTDVYFDWNK